MSYNRGYQTSMGQPNPWASGAPPNQVMSGLMTPGYQPAGPQNHFAPNPNYGLAAGNAGINWNTPQGQVPPNNMHMLKMGQPQAWNQGVVVGNPRMGNQRTPNNKRNGNWNDGGNQMKRMNRGTPNNNNNNNNNNRNNMVKNTPQQNSNRKNNWRLHDNSNNNNNNRNFNNNNNQNNQNNNLNSNQKKRNQNQNNRVCLSLENIY